MPPFPSLSWATPSQVPLFLFSTNWQQTLKGARGLSKASVEAFNQMQGNNTQRRSYLSLMCKSIWRTRPHCVDLPGEWVQMSPHLPLEASLRVPWTANESILKKINPGRKPMTNLDSTLKSRDVTLPSKVHLVKAMVFPGVMYGCESWTIKKAEHHRIDALNCGIGEDSQESLGLQDQTSQS